ncbi:Crp/Fnr family transcriptional regulator [Bradyrhizobium sp. HKCCYLS20291]|uniref:Crp/Fnr family transcriptional regulator n=1 Tax=Bradyrhizobium sp. HKCCYLS20291 TaxID=3420766 RepID=UPI003EB711A5
MTVTPNSHAIGRQSIHGNGYRPTSIQIADLRPAFRTDDGGVPDQLASYGRTITLRPQQRFSLTAANEIIVLLDGFLALDAAPTTSRLQILDFLVAGDVVAAPIIRTASGLSVRAITSARLVSFDISLLEDGVLPSSCWSFLFDRCQQQIFRSHLHQLMTGRLEIEPRVASFLLAMSCIYNVKPVSGVVVRLPMSRADIANYLVMNSDTLSRTMVKFSTLGLIKRVSRHTILLLDLDRLRTRSPLARQMASAPVSRGHVGSAARANLQAMNENCLKSA